MLTNYRFVVFAISALLVFNDVAWRTIATFAAIGGMLKKNCTDPDDPGEYCWTEHQKGAFLGAFYYGYALQILPTLVASKLGYNLFHRFSLFASAILQVTCPLSIGYSPVLATFLQGFRGLTSGIMFPNIFAITRSWSCGDEGNILISGVGAMLFLGSGVGPFIASGITEAVGWRYPYYVSGAANGLLFVAMCVFMPANPLECRFISEKERRMFVEKERKAVDLAKESKDLAVYKVSYRGILGRAYVHMMCVWQIANLFLFYTDYIATPFYLEDVFSVDVESLGYIQLAMSLTSCVFAVIWKSLLPIWDKLGITWFRSRVALMLLPVVVNGLLTTVIGNCNTLAGVVCCLIVKSVVQATLFAGSLMTLVYELDPFNAPLVTGIFNSIGQVMGFASPLVMTAMVSRDDSVRAEWRNYYLMETGVALAGAVSVVVAVVTRPAEWRLHPVLEEDRRRREKRGGDEEKEEKGGVVIENPNIIEEGGKSCGLGI